jgi:formiminotetrahydrofolate cyclodeaminase
MVNETKKKAKQLKIDAAKRSAPNVPGHTCPSIDYVLELITQIADRGDDWALKQAKVAADVMEYIRESNDELRSSSHYWYTQFKKVV